MSALKKDTEDAQDRYVEARLDGLTQGEAKEIAGYSASTHNLEAIGTPIRNKLTDAMRSRGMDEFWFARKLKEGVDASLEFGAKEKDLNALACLLRQVPYNLGYRKDSAPAVAVQINNRIEGGGANLEPDTARALAQLLPSLIQALQTEVGAGGSTVVHGGSPGAEVPPAHEGVVKSPEQGEVSGSSGIA